MRNTFSICCRAIRTTSRAFALPSRRNMNSETVDTVHPLARSAFTNVGSSGLYDRARPSYPPELVDHIFATIPKGQRFNVVELGSGTGIATRLCLSRPAIAHCAEWTAVEPASGMRASFDASITSKAAADGPRITCVDGAFDRIPVPDGSADIILAAQAFHWIGREKANAENVMKEIGRALRPKTGALCLIWNLEDRESADWVAQVRDQYESHEKETPQYRHGYWKVIYETDAYKTLFDGKHKREESVQRVLPTTKEGVEERVASKSYISDLADDTRNQLLRRVKSVLDTSDSLKWIDESKGIFEYPYRTDLVVIPIARG